MARKGTDKSEKKSRSKHHNHHHRHHHHHHHHHDHKSRHSEHKSKESKSRTSSKKPDSPTTGIIQSRKEITAVNINMNGKGVLGFSPKYKVNMIQDFLGSFPDIVFFQDSIEYNDLKTVFENSSEGKYEFHFQELGEDDERNEGDGMRAITGIAWNKIKYIGTPLQLDDEVLQEQRGWIVRHDITVVKLDSREMIGSEDMYPSLVAVAWHGPDYDTPLKDRTKEGHDLFSFLSLIREKNKNIPMLIGGDFNMDMKSFNMKAYPEFLVVPYRPVSGTLAKDLKNTFMFTMDSLQVIETGVKQHHPEIFPAPFVSARIRGKAHFRVWAVVRIQRAVRRWIKRKRERQEAKIKVLENKRRWKKKLGVDEDDESPDDERHIRWDDQTNQESKEAPGNNNKDSKIKKTRKDRKYALYWDEADDPRYQEESKEMSSEEYERRRRKDFTSEVSSSVFDDMYEKPVTIRDVGYRRRRFGDLKSVQDRKREEQLAEAMFSSRL